MKNVAERTKLVLNEIIPKLADCVAMGLSFTVMFENCKLSDYLQSKKDNSDIRIISSSSRICDLMFFGSFIESLLKDEKITVKMLRDIFELTLSEINLQKPENKN